MDGVLAVLPALSPSSHDAVRAPCPNGRTRFGVLVLSHERPKTSRRCRGGGRRLVPPRRGACVLNVPGSGRSAQPLGMEWRFPASNKTAHQKERDEVQVHFAAHHARA